MTTASRQRPITVALDAMGGDNAPAAIVRGAQLAAREGLCDLILVGRGSELRSILPAPQAHLRLAEASEAVAMDAQPTQVRQMPDSSIMVGLQLVADGHADAFLSFGNTGAVMAASLLRLGRIPGVARPALGALFHNARGATSLILDVGANAEVRPDYLCQFAAMGKAYFERVLHHRNPSVGLLNVGEESAKGTAVVQEAYALLSRQEPNFVGNIEGDALIRGMADVVVTDGFTGNVAVKVSEGVVERVMGELRKSIKQRLLYMAGAWLIRGAFDSLRDQWDYSRVGSAPLFGINGAVLVGHGRADAEAVASGIRSACGVVESNVVEAIRDAFAGAAERDAPAESDAPANPAHPRGQPRSEPTHRL